MQVTRAGRFLNLIGERLHVRLNCLRGLALDAWVDRQVSEKSLCGTVHHGYYDDIQWAADYYSCHLVFESPGRPKVTDLSAVEPEIEHFAGGVMISADVKTSLGMVRKVWRIDDVNGRLTLSYRLHWKGIGIGSLRLGYLTLNPEAFDVNALRYKTHNGGRDLEIFNLTGTDFDHGAPVSFLISANQAVGLTAGQMEVGDDDSTIHLQTDKSTAAAVGLVMCRKIVGSYLYRSAFSLKELDDTSKGKSDDAFDFEMVLSAR